MGEAEEGNKMMESIRDNMKVETLKISFFFFFPTIKIPYPEHLLLYSLKDVRHRGIWQMFPFYVCERPQCLSKQQNQSDIANKWRAKRTASQNFPFLTSVGLNRCRARLHTRALSLSQPARLTSKPRIWLAVKIEPDGNWLHITCVLQLKKVSSKWGIKKVWEQRRRGHPYLSQQPSSRSVHCQRAAGGEAAVKKKKKKGSGGGWQSEGAQPDSLTGPDGSETDTEGQLDADKSGVAGIRGRGPWTGRNHCLQSPVGPEDLPLALEAWRRERRQSEDTSHHFHSFL